MKNKIKMDQKEKSMLSPSKMVNIYVKLLKNCKWFLLVFFTLDVIILSNLNFQRSLNN